MRATIIASCVVTVVVSILVASCGGGGGGGGGGTPLPVPVLASINGSTTPASPPGFPIDLSGSGFGIVPGTVRFTQNGVNTDVTNVPTGAWNDTSIAVVVPSALTAGTVGVSVINAGGQSVTKNVSIVIVAPYSPSNISWTSTTSLPKALRAHWAVAVKGASANTAFVYTLGGNDGTTDLATVQVATVDQTGAVTATWTTTSSLPAARAFLCGAVADESTSPVPTGSAFIYAIGGQQTATDAPGGTNTVFFASVSTSTGALGAWTPTTSLPQTRVGARAVVSNGILHVVGGVDATGAPIRSVVSAQINADGSLGAFASNSPLSDLPTAVSFHDAFAFGGFLFVIGGDTGSVVNPFAASSTQATGNVSVAPIIQGNVTAFATTSSTIKAIEKHVVFSTFGQPVLYEGLYGGSPGSKEGERSAITVDSSGNLALSSWNGLTGSQVPNLNTFNLGGVTSPILTTANLPRWILIGGDSAAAPGTLSATVRVGGP